MASLDLKPLTKEAIQKMGITDQDLWQVKINGETFGPFEVETLRNYLSENEDLFTDAWSCRQDSKDWRPIFEHEPFVLKEAQIAKENHEGPFWVLDNGQKVGPFHKHDIVKRIEFGTLTLSDLLSINDGHTWHKVFDHKAFNDQCHAPSELPEAPDESCFLKVEAELLERMESTDQGISIKEELATVAHLSQKRSKTAIIKLDEIPWTPNSDTPVSSSMKWALPAAMFVFVSLFVGYRLWIAGTDEVDLVAEEIPQKMPPGSSAPKARTAPRAVVRKPAESARINHYSPREVPVHTPAREYPESRFPTHVETHENDLYQANEPDPLVDPVAEAEEPPQANQEPSIVNNGAEDQGTDYNDGREPSGGAVVEEVSDF